jgi:hypothetical protein
MQAIYQVVSKCKVWLAEVRRGRTFFFSLLSSLGAEVAFIIQLPSAVGTVMMIKSLKILQASRNLLSTVPAAISPTVAERGPLTDTRNNVWGYPSTKRLAAQLGLACRESLTDTPAQTITRK